MLTRLRAALDYLNYRGFMLFGSIYLGAASLIGFESLALLLGYATIWPVGIPVLLAFIAVWAALTRRRRGRSEQARALQQPRASETTALAQDGPHKGDPRRDEELP